jgi:putative tryptophan/tyrosine transport system substrate-binding protein
MGGRYIARRDLLCASLAALAAAAFGAPVQTPAPRRAARIGVLLPVPGNEPFLAILRDGLRELGWIENDRLAIEVRHADGTVDAFLRLGRELTARDVDVMVTASTAAATALATLTTRIPIVFVGAFDPVAAGLVVSLDHPGGNLTGIAGLQSAIAGEWVSLLMEIAPSVQRCVIFYNPASMPSAVLAGYKSAAAERADVGEVRVESIDDIDRVIAGVATDRHAGIIVVPHTFPFANRQLVVEAMARHRVPAIYGIVEMVRSGGLISYGQDLGAQWRMSAQYLDRILKGEMPADMPVRYAPRYSLAINRAAAGALDLTPPQGMLERADEVSRGSLPPLTPVP